MRRKVGFCDEYVTGVYYVLDCCGAGARREITRKPPLQVRFFTKNRKETPTGTAESRRMVLCSVMMIYSEGRKKITASDKPVTLPRLIPKATLPKGSG